MSKEDLIPIRTTERAKELGRRGGLSRSWKKSRAASIRNLKRITDPDKKKQRLIELITDPKMFNFELVKMYDEIISNEALTPKERIDLLKAMTGVKGAVHGTVSKNLNINVDLSKWKEEREKLWQTRIEEQYSKKPQKKKEHS